MEGIELYGREGRFHLFRQPGQLHSMEGGFVQQAFTDPPIVGSLYCSQVSVYLVVAQVIILRFGIRVARETLYCFKVKYEAPYLPRTYLSEVYG